MPKYELQKVENYYIEAASEEEAIEALNGLDNSSAHRIETRAIWASAPEEERV